MPKIQRALISLSDKNGIVPFAKGLHALGVEILSTGGTAKLLKKNGIPVLEVGDYTGQPEILEGRLKTLHPKIHGGILGIRSNPEHVKEMKQSEIQPIDMVVVTLYPFEETIAKTGISLQEAVENIDIGGPTMIRAAAKNWQDVTVIVDPEDYEKVLEEMRRGDISVETNFRLAKKVFVLTSRYEGAIANYLCGQEKIFPDVLNLQMSKVQELRYGENPHQKAAFYRDIVGVGPRAYPSQGDHGGSPLQEPCVSTSKQIHGKELSFNNILDLEAALGLMKEFDQTSVVIMKHTNPCGVAILSPDLRSPSPPPNGGHSARGEGYDVLQEIFVAARDADPLSAFGGIIGLNRRVDEKTASEIAKDFYECVMAPGFDPEALEILTAKKNIRLMEISTLAAWYKTRKVSSLYDMKKVAGGFLVQDRDLLRENIREAKVVTQKSPQEHEWDCLAFAWRVCKHVKSNAIVFAAGDSIFRTVGIGCGQMSRVDAVKIGTLKARSSLKGCVMASDAFFPFRDNVDEAARVGVAAIIQPGGSLKDAESIQAADEQGIAMVFTGVRHFKH